MATHAPVHPRPTGTSGAAGTAVSRRTVAVILPRPLLITLGLAALWMALIVAIVLASQLAGMAALDAWAYAIGIVSYIYMFTGFIVGLIYLVSRADRSYESKP